jgi:hypothetical protein
VVWVPDGANHLPHDGQERLKRGERERERERERETVDKI